MKVTLNYTKPMIDLIHQIRHRLPSEYKPNVKFANPELLTELVHYFHLTDDVIVKALIKDLMERAGEPWTLYVSSSRMGKPAKKSKELMYRGQAVVGGN